jgi:hypothetical protein
MKLVTVASVWYGGVNAVTIRSQVAATASAELENELLGVWSKFDHAIIKGSNSNADESMELEQAVTHLQRRGVPEELRLSLAAAKMHVKSLSEAANEAAAEYDSSTNASAAETQAIQAAPTVTDVMKKIFAIINTMIVTDQNKLVMSVFTCSKHRAVFKSGWETNRMNFNAESYKLEEALGHEKLGQLEQMEADVRLRNLIPSRDDMEKRCHADIEQLRGEFKRITYDYNLAVKIAEGTSCAKTAPAPTFMQTCARMVADGRKEGLVQFPEGSREAGMVSMLQTDTARRAFHRGLIEAVGPEQLLAPPPLSLYQVSARQQHLAEKLLASESESDDEEAMSAEADELTHRQSDFRDYFFEDADFEGDSGVVDEVYEPSSKFLEESAVIKAAVVEIEHQTAAQERDTSDEDAPPGGWISTKDLARAARELVLLGAEGAATTTAAPVTLPYQDLDNHMSQPSSKWFCTTAANPNCVQFRDKLETIVAELLSEKQHVSHLLSTTEDECDRQIEELDSQIANMNAKKNDGARIEADASGRKSDAQVSMVAIEKEGRELLASAHRWSEQCREEIRGFRDAVCASKKLKQEVITIESQQKGGDKLEIYDCAVSDWAEGECMNTNLALALQAQGVYDPADASKAGIDYKGLLHPCGAGGGLKWYQRTQVGNKTAVYGADCPPLRLKTSCNDFECPVNCKLGDWEGWSACSKTCDGGLKRRVREVLVYPQWRGEECDDTKNEEACNVLACDRPCELHSWTAWRTCTRACSGGMRWRTRGIRRLGSGDGKCARTFSNARYHRETCNTGPCPQDVVCIARIDLVIGLDASGSMGTDGWNAQRTALLNMVNRMHLSKLSGILLGALKFSWHVTVIHQLSDDKAKLSKAITDTKFDSWTTNIGGAFRTMQTMLQFGRRDAPSVCVLWTDGMPSRPSSKFDSASASRDLKSACRVMVVTMRPAVPRSYVLPWVSHPQDVNVMVVQDPTLMTKKVMELNTFVCGKVQKFLDWNFTSTTTAAAR